MEFNPVNLTATMNEAELKLIQSLLVDVNEFLELRAIRLYIEQSTTLAGPLGDTIKIQLNALVKIMGRGIAHKEIVDARVVSSMGSDTELKETLATLQMIDEA